MRLPSLGRGWLLAFLPLLCWYVVGGAIASLTLGSGGALAAAREITRVFGIAMFVPALLIAREAGLSAARIRAVCLFAAVPALVAAYYQAAAGTGDQLSGFNRVVGTFVHPNTLGTYLVAIIVPTVGILAAERAGRGAQVALVLAACPPLILTFSRVSYLMLFVAVIGMAFGLFVLEGRRAWHLSLWSMVLLVAVVVAAWAPISGRFADIRLSPGALGEAALAGESVNSLEWRLMTWAILVQQGLEHPIVGHGLGTASLLNPVVAESLGRPFGTHNDWVTAFFEVGAIGLLLYLWMAVSITRVLLRAAREVGPGQRASQVGVAAVLTTGFLVSLGAAEMLQATAVLYAICGLIVASAPATSPETSPAVNA
jgi:O-antigen ligase